MISFLLFVKVIALFIAIISFLVVSVIALAFKIQNPADTEFKGLFDTKSAKYSIITLVLSVILLISSSVLASKSIRDEIKYELFLSDNASIHINGYGMDNDSLLSDIKKIVPASSQRNTGKTKINITISRLGNKSEIQLLRSFSDSTKYWVSYPKYGSETIGEINTKYLNSFRD